MFSDMKDGATPEGSQLITPRGYVSPRSTLILHREFEGVCECRIETVRRDWSPAVSFCLYKDAYLANDADLMGLCG